MKNINALLVALVLLVTSCKREEAVPEVSLNDFSIEFVVDGKDKVVISQQEDPEIQVYGSSGVMYKTQSDSTVLQYRATLRTPKSGVNVLFTHSTNKTPHRQGGNRYTDDMLQYLRKKVLASPVKFAPTDDTGAFAFSMEFGDTRFPLEYNSYMLGLVNGVISPIPANQSNSHFTITHHHKIKLKEFEYSGYDAEQIEGTFSMKLYSREDTISVTDGKFKMFMILN